MSDEELEKKAHAWFLRQGGDPGEIKAYIAGAKAERQRIYKELSEASNIYKPMPPSYRYVDIGFIKRVCKQEEA